MKIMLSPARRADLGGGIKAQSSLHARVLVERPFQSVSICLHAQPPEQYRPDGPIRDPPSYPNLPKHDSFRPQHSISGSHLRARRHGRLCGGADHRGQYRFPGVAGGRRSQDRRAFVQRRGHRDQVDCPGQCGGPGCGLDHLSGSCFVASGRRNRHRAQQGHLLSGQPVHRRRGRALGHPWRRYIERDRRRRGLGFRGRPRVRRSRLGRHRKQRDTDGAGVRKFRDRRICRQ